MKFYLLDGHVGVVCKSGTRPSEGMEGEKMRIQTQGHSDCLQAFSDLIVSETLPT